MVSRCNSQVYIRVISGSKTSLVFISQTFQKYPPILPSFGHDHFLPNHFQLTILLSILRYTSFNTKSSLICGLVCQNFRTHCLYPCYVQFRAQLPVVSEFVKCFNLLKPTGCVLRDAPTV